MVRLTPIMMVPEMELWTLCNEEVPQLGFCLFAPQVREIRRRFLGAVALWQHRAIDMRERNEKLGSRLNATAADARSKLILTIVLPIATAIAGAFAAWGIIELAGRFPRTVTVP